MTSTPTVTRRTGVSTRRRGPRPEGGWQRHSALWSLAALIVTFIALGAALGGVFRVREVDVVGSNLPRAAIVQASGVEGENIFAVSAPTVINRLATIQQIAVSKVESRFPNRLVIYARHRIAMAAWRRGSALYLVDPDGRIIQEVKSTKLPTITGTGGMHSLSPGIVQAMRAAVRILPSQPNGAVGGFTYSHRRGLVINGLSGWQADIGNGAPQMLVNRVSVLAAFLQRTANRPGLRIVDLRFRVPYAKYSQ